MNRIGIKERSKQQIRDHIGMLFVHGLIIVGVGLLLSMIPVVGTAAFVLIVAPALSLSVIKVYLGIVKGRKPLVGDLLDGFYDLWCAIKVNFFTCLYISLWSLLFVIPGIMKAFSYAMAMYVLAENRGMSAHKAISMSKKMMKGRRMELFVLLASFLGWIILGVITFGVAFIWVGPYMQAAMTNFYNNIKPSDEKDDVADVESTPVIEAPKPEAEEPVAASVIAEPVEAEPVEAEPVEAEPVEAEPVEEAPVEEAEKTEE